jgi:hypothetical protein
MVRTIFFIMTAMILFPCAALIPGVGQADAQGLVLNKDLKR